MFGLFKKASTGITVVDKVWMSKAAKLKACAEMFQLNPGCLFITWFKETYEELQLTLNLKEGDPGLALAEHVHPSDAANRMVIFAEHHPLREIEQALFRKLALKEVPVLSALDEPFFFRFGGQKT